MGSLVAGVAHEVRNPLFAISVNVDALQEIETNPDLDEILGALRREVKRLGVLMEDLITYGKPATTAPMEGPLEATLDLALQACAPLVSSTGVAILSTVERGTWVLRMNRDRMAQVFENLFRNALQLAPPGSTVTVEAEGFLKHGDCWVRCRVSDQGPGFRPSDLPRIFEPFFSRRRGGTGLGLAIVQRIVEEHGGAVCALNRDEGGAVMVVELPCVER
jgi:signal transduction histidine kinase